MIDLMWNEDDATFYDFDYSKNTQQPYNSATNLYPLWAKLCSQEMAERIVKKHLPLLVYKGGIASTSHIIHNPEQQTEIGRQWDFPYGWAPHQMLIWEGLITTGLIKKHRNSSIDGCGLW